MTDETLCERCGKILRVGDFPFCKGRPTDHTPGVTGIDRDEIPGGMWLENYGPHPIKVYSHTERRKLMKTVQYDKTTGQPYVLTERETFAPMPGTDKDAQGIPNPMGYRDLSAAALIARNGRRAFDDDETLDSLAGGARLDRHDPDDIPNDPAYRDARVRDLHTDSDEPDALDQLVKILEDYS
jgi:hypothetical protein